LPDTCYQQPRKHLMSKAATPSRWFPGWRTAQRPMQDDPADLGTAFGLEMSLNEAAKEAAKEAAADAAQRAPAPSAGARPRGLMQRLTGRRKTSD
jgi:hypothetical protein